jgi:hypothetical protein
MLLAPSKPTLARFAQTAIEQHQPRQSICALVLPMQHFMPCALLEGHMV